MGGLDHKYLRLADLRRLRHLVFSPRRPTEGRYAGRHASAQRGHSVEFRDYRPYMPGDEITDIDWKVFGRSDRMVVKLFEHTSDMTVHLLVDGSASMAYSGAVEGRRSKVASRRTQAEQQEGAPESKYDHACMLAAAIAFLVIKQQDKVSFAAAHEGLKGFAPADGSQGHLEAILKSMDSIRPSGEARLADALRLMTPLTSRRGLLILFSDLLDNPGPLQEALSIYTHRGLEVIVFHILHPDELNLPPLDEALLEDSENGLRIPLHKHDIQAAYKQRITQFLDFWPAALRSRGVDYKLVPTTTRYIQALQEFLFTRSGVA